MDMNGGRTDVPGAPHLRVALSGVVLEHADGLLDVSDCLGPIGGGAAREQDRAYGPQPP